MCRLTEQVCGPTAGNIYLGGTGQIMVGILGNSTYLLSIIPRCNEDDVCVCPISHNLIPKFEFQSFYPCYLVTKQRLLLLVIVLRSLLVDLTRLHGLVLGIWTHTVDEEGSVVVASVQWITGVSLASVAIILITDIPAGDYSEKGSQEHHQRLEHEAGSSHYVGCDLKFQLELQRLHKKQELENERRPTSFKQTVIVLGRRPDDFTHNHPFVHSHLQAINTEQLGKTARPCIKPLGKLTSYTG